MANAFTAALGRMESRARYAAIGIMCLVVVSAIMFPCAHGLARSYMDQAGMGNPDIVLRPGFKVAVDGHARAVIGFVPCPEDPRPWKDYWLGGPPTDSERSGAFGCVVVAPDTTSVHVRYLTSGTPAEEIWTVEHREYKDMPVTVAKRPNGEYVLPADQGER
ncbi:hypothetical protein A8H39_01900 [Paraburkholderia fungorum]|uniref:hypothetical protein n=1 Tax=Paraburkholderia fungorum TaxID=134537 RepID=UPI0004864C70|nr:hypothetical protein [Paraburkholderia fungorum]MBB5546598.1 hypothetical protein [Paraburkholderia fungorum]PNE59925.1 hypothetical protein A8H39_01900 [Paraburkholderia fungorum]